MTVRIDVFKTEQYDGNFPTENAVEFNNWLRDIIDSVPIENRGDLKIEIEGIDNYGSAYSTIEIFYYRDETEEELLVIKEKKVSNKKKEVTRKHILLERLKSELGET